MGTVTISGNQFEIYGTNTAAIVYHAASLSPAAVAWSAAAPTSQDKSLVAATRYIDSFAWAGSKTDPDQELAWPRTGVTDREGVAVDDATVPLLIEQACYELAPLILADPTLVEQASGGGSNIQAVTGPVGVTFFAPQTATPLPSLLMRLVGQFLAGASASAQGSYGASEATGTCTEDAFGPCDRYEREGF